MTALWRRCSACKDPIETGSVYWACNVSTCNRKRTALAFCSVDCWEVHLPGANHREAWAVEKTAPHQTDEDTLPTRRESGGRLRIASQPREEAPAEGASGDDREILVIASRLKAYVKKRSGYNTSDRVLAPLSDLLRSACDRAIESARREGRMTVLDRDVSDPS